MRQILTSINNPGLNELLSDKFRYENGIILKSATNGVDTILQARNHNPDVVILSNDHKDMQVGSICRDLLEYAPAISIIVLMDSRSTDNEASLLSLGVSNVLTSPFDSEVFVATIHSRLVRKELLAPESRSILKSNNLYLDAEKFEVKVNNRTVNLTATEFELLKLLLANKGFVVSRDKILNSVLGYDTSLNTHVVDVHISRLRRKIAGKTGNIIQTVVGFGYKIPE